jgi:hypothetical protein
VTISVDGGVLQPVFVDLTGRRAFRIDRASRAFVVLVALYVLLLGASVAWVPVVGRVRLPGFLEGKTASAPSRADDTVLLRSVGSDQPTAGVMVATHGPTPVAAAVPAPPVATAGAPTPVLARPTAVTPQPHTRTTTATTPAPGSSGSAPGHAGSGSTSGSPSGSASVSNNSSNGHGPDGNGPPGQQDANDVANRGGSSAAPGNGHGRAVGNPH